MEMIFLKIDNSEKCQVSYVRRNGTCQILAREAQNRDSTVAKAASDTIPLAKSDGIIPVA